MEHCKNCSKCCELIMINGTPIEKVYKLVKEKGLDPIYQEMLIPLTREQALHINERAVYEREASKINEDNPVSFYTCSKLENGRCSIYDKRPKMCSGYPYTWSKWADHATLSKQQYIAKEPRYSETCTYLPGIIPVVNI